MINGTGCHCARLSQVAVLSKWLNGSSWFWHGGFRQPVLHDVMRKFMIFKNKGTCLRKFVPNSPQHVDRRRHCHLSSVSGLLGLSWKKAIKRLLLLLLLHRVITPIVSNVTHTCTQPFYGPLSGSTWVSRYQKKHYIHPLKLLLLINHPDQLPPSTTNHSIIPAQSTAWQSLCTTSNHVLFNLPLGLSTSYSIHFFSQSLSSFHNTCPYRRNLFCCSTEIMSTIPSLSLMKRIGHH